MRSITRLIVGITLVGVSAIGGALAQSMIDRTPAVSQDGVAGGYESPHLDEAGRLSEHQQLRTYFLNGSRDRVK